jgi:preprotein translocase subunit SecA
MIASDGEYRQRLERHYAMWKSVVDDPLHPDHSKTRASHQGGPQGESAYPRQLSFRRELPKVGANDPCPCGSGRKYKRCCRK